jgi:hypothetical protein
MNIKDVPFRNLVLMIVNGMFGDSFDSITCPRTKPRQQDNGIQRINNIGHKRLKYIQNTNPFNNQAYVN